MTVQDPGLSDEALALEAQKGDRQAFEALLGRHKHAQYRLIRRYVGNADDAYDILQDAWISVWESLNRYDPKRPFAAWVRVIILNKCHDFGRRRRFRRMIVHAFGAEPQSEYAPGDPLDTPAIAEQLRLQHLDQAIAALPTLYKEPLILTLTGGLSQEAAAVVLRTTPKAIEMRLRRARQRLVEALNPKREG